MANKIAANLPILTFENQPAWEDWLRLHLDDHDGALLKMAKKNSGIFTINYDQALESALCFGWIDSQIFSFDDHYYLHKFSPRRPGSKWSKMNCEKAERLIAAGQMQPAGLQQVELARADGRWQSAYDPQSRIKVPEDLQRELDQNPAAKAFFATLDSQNRYAFLHHLQAPKKPETRQKRIKKYIGMLANHEKIYS